MSVELAFPLIDFPNVTQLQILLVNQTRFCPSGFVQKGKQLFLHY